MRASTRPGAIHLVTQLRALIVAVQEANALLASEQTPPAAAVPANGPVTVIGQTVHGMSARPAWTQGLTDEQLLDGATTSTTGRIPITTLSNGVHILWSKQLGPLIQGNEGLKYFNGNDMDPEHSQIFAAEATVAAPLKPVTREEVVRGQAAQVAMMGVDLRVKNIQDILHPSRGEISSIVGRGVTPREYHDAGYRGVL